MELLNQSATLFKGAIQVSGIRYSFYQLHRHAARPAAVCVGRVQCHGEEPEHAGLGAAGLDQDLPHRHE